MGKGLRVPGTRGILAKIEREFISLFRELIMNIDWDGTQGRVAARVLLLDLGLFAALGAAAFLPVAWFGRPTQLFTVVAVAGLSILLGLDSRIPNPLLRYLSRNCGLWLGFLIGGNALFYMPWEPFLAALMGIPVFCGAAMIGVGSYMSREDRVRA